LRPSRRKLKPDDARALTSALTGLLIEAIKWRINSYQFSALPQAVAAIAAQLKPDDARALTSTLIEAIKGTSPPNELRALARAIAAIAPQLKPDDARALTSPLIEAIKGTTNSYQLSVVAQAFAAIAPQLKPDDARALTSTLTGRLIEAIKGTTDSYQLSALAEAFAAIAPQLKPDDASALTSTLTEVMEQLLPDVKTIEAFAAAAEQLPWPERLKLLAFVLKYPTVYGDARDELIKQIKKHPAANTIKPPGDFWAVVEWLWAQSGIDLARPPERTKTANR
jgi:hypothetical protein